MSRGLKKFGFCVIALALSLWLNADDNFEFNKQTDKVEHAKSTEKDEQQGDLSEQSENESTNAARFDFLFKNPAIISGLNLGTDTINRSIDSLMENVFYSLLDNEFRFDVSTTSYFDVALTRNLYSATRGAYVVVDNLSYGPSYQQLLGKFDQTTLSIGAEGRMEIMNIYLRTDAERLRERALLPKWRSVVNNWFGLIPFLSQILPPSFNPNAMYDPIQQLKTPLSFPLSIKAFNDMPVGSIRSYAVSGGINLPLELNNQLSDYSKQALRKIGLDLSFPLSVFVGGTHRISILKKGPNLAWVGVTNESRLGNRIYALLGKTYYIFSNTLKAIPWKGVKVLMSPLEFEQINSTLKRKDLLFRFDTASLEGTKNFLRAIKGDFGRMAPDAALDRQIGKAFLLRKDQESLESQRITSNNITVGRQERKKLAQQSEIQIQDESQSAYVLEALLELNSLSWDMILGPEEKNLNARSQISVAKVDSKNSEEGIFAKIKPQLFLNSNIEYRLKGEEPYYLLCTYSIKNNQFNVKDYNLYIDELKKFTKMHITQAKNISEFDQIEAQNYRKSAFFTRPDRTIFDIHVKNPPLGKFQAIGSLYFSFESIKKLASLSEAVLWHAFGDAFGLSAPDRDQLARGNLATHFYHRTRSLFFTPTNLINLYFPSIDAVGEIKDTIFNLKSLENSKNPRYILSAFYGILNTNYPKQKLAAFLSLLDSNEVGKKLVFYIQPKDNVDGELKALFAGLNKASFEGKKPFPQITRYNVDPQKLNAFVPQKIASKKSPSRINKIRLARHGNDQVYADLQIKQPEKDKSVFVYARLENLATLKLGTSVLGENVFELKQKKDFDGTIYYRFFITGEESPLSNYFLAGSLSSEKRYSLSVSISDDTLDWSNESSLVFKISPGGTIQEEPQ